MLADLVARVGGDAYLRLGPSSGHVRLNRRAEQRPRANCARRSPGELAEDPGSIPGGSTRNPLIGNGGRVLLYSGGGWLVYAYAVSPLVFTRCRRTSLWPCPRFARTTGSITLQSNHGGVTVQSNHGVQNTGSVSTPWFKAENGSTPQFGPRGLGVRLVDPVFLTRGLRVGALGGRQSGAGSLPAGLHI